MIPRDAQLLIEGKIKKRDNELERLDRMFANQTARLMYMQGRTAEKPIEPVSCLTYQWEPQNTAPLPEEMTEEDMENFDRCMDSHRGKRDG
jgi:hypothetical protein